MLDIWSLAVSGLKGCFAFLQSQQHPFLFHTLFLLIFFLRHIMDCALCRHPERAGVHTDVLRGPGYRRARPHHLCLLPSFVLVQNCRHLGWRWRQGPAGKRLLKARCRGNVMPQMEQGCLKGGEVRLVTLLMQGLQLLLYYFQSSSEAMSQTCKTQVILVYSGTY